MKKLFLLFFLLAASTVLFAQDFEVPKNYEFETEEDCVKYNQDILKCIEWLEQTPLDTEKSKREEANKFLIAWAIRSPDVTISLSDKNIPYIKTNPDLLLVFMGGWIKYSLQNNAKNDIENCTLSATESVIAFYQKNKSLMKKDKNIEKYIKLQSKGELAEYVKEKMK